MYILSLAIKNLLRNKRKTFILGFLITTISLLVFVTNGIFEKTNTGLESLYVNSLTGDFLIAKDSEKINSIFGYEMPLVSSYEPVDQLETYLPITENLSIHSDKIQYTPIISAAVRLELENSYNNVAIFGIDAKNYFDTLKDIDIDKSAIDLLQAGNGGIIINETLAKSIEKTIKRPLKMGETLQLTTSTEGTFRIRKAVLAGILSYDSTTEPFNKIVLCDPQIVRELLMYTNTVDQTVELDKSAVDLVNIDFDDLFSDFSEDFAVTSESTSDEILANVGSLFENSANDETDYASIITWSFILAKAQANVTNSEVLTILTNDVTDGFDVQIMDWSQAAGTTAQAPIALQLSFNIGMIFIIIGSILVIVNGLVISVLERTREIGTMRAIGASKKFITKLYSAEMIILILFFSFLGMLLGLLICVIIQANPIILTNGFLITLFGSETVSPLINAKLVCSQIVVSVLIAVLAWQYPVLAATRIQPAQTMGKEI